MRLRRLPELAEGAEALDAPGDALSTVVSRLVPPGSLKDALSGTWLGHALHPVLTDLPIGFWTSSLMVDFFGGRRGVSCPWHGSVFRLHDGEVTSGPAALPQPRYEVRVREGQLEVRRFALAAR